ncbi:MAG: hypothetical protein AAGF78_05415 [Pseudomonadota bacterium]
MRSLVLVLALSLAGCAQLPEFLGNDAPPKVAIAVPVEPVADIPDPEAETGLVKEEVAEPVPAPSNETLATLGNAAEPGLWLKTPLVSSQGPGRVTSVDNGRVVEVTLIPLDAEPTAGSRASLAALQALGLSLTAISPLIVEPI